MTPAMPPSPIRCHTFSSVIASYDLESDSQFTKTPATLSRSFSRLLAPRTGWQDQPDRRRHDPHQPAQFLHCGAQRWHEDDDVPEWPDLLFNDPATTEIYTLSLHDALPI